jgi:hypothetical protein
MNHAVFASDQLISNESYLLNMLQLLTEGPVRPIKRGVEGHVLVFWNYDASHWEGPCRYFDHLGLVTIRNVSLSVIPSTKVQEVDVREFFGPKYTDSGTVQRLVSERFSKEYVRMCDNVFGIFQFFTGTLKFWASEQELYPTFEFVSSFGQDLIRISAWNFDHRISAMKELWKFALCRANHCLTNRAPKRIGLNAIDFVIEISSFPEFYKFMEDETFKDLKSTISKLIRISKTDSPVGPDNPLSNIYLPKWCLKTPTGGPFSTYLFPYCERLVLASLQKAEERSLKNTNLGRVLNESSPRDQRLALLSKEAPAASIKWQKGRLIGRGASASVCVLFRSPFTFQQF